MSDLYDRDANRIDETTWVRLRENSEYVGVALYKDERITISTVWHGVHRTWLRARGPMIFETMIFGASGVNVSSDLDEAQWRWRTEAEAKQGHDTLVACYHDGNDPDGPVRALRKKHAES